MTPTEIRNLIAKKIEGQGSAIDIGNGLPAILNGILDMIADIPTPKEEVVFDLTDYPAQSFNIFVQENVYNQIVGALKTKQVFVKIVVSGNTFKSMVAAFIETNGNPEGPLTVFAATNAYSIIRD